VFDFDGDGVAESSTTSYGCASRWARRRALLHVQHGATLWCPVIVDVDNGGRESSSRRAPRIRDRACGCPGLGQCELDRIAAGRSGTNGVRVFAAPRDWVATRDLEPAQLSRDERERVGPGADGGARQLDGRLAQQFPARTQPGAADVPIAARDLAVDLTDVEPDDAHFVVVKDGRGAGRRSVRSTSKAHVRAARTRSCDAHVVAVRQDALDAYNLGARSAKRCAW
jgi:hypothetical protein